MATILYYKDKRRKLLYFTILLCIIMTFFVRISWKKYPDNFHLIYVDKKDVFIESEESRICKNEACSVLNCENQICNANIKEISEMKYYLFKSIVEYFGFEVFFFGTLIFFLIFVLLQYIHSFREEIGDTYLFYLGYLIIGICYYSRLLHYSWTSNGQLFYELLLSTYGSFAETFFSVVFSITYILFVFSFLKIPSLKVDFAFNKALWSYLLLCIIFSIGDVFIFFLWDTEIIGMEIGFKVPLHILFIFFFIKLYRKRDWGKTIQVRLALYILAGSFFLYLGATITAVIGINQMMSQNTHLYIPVIGKQFFFKIGFLIENILFIVALGYRTRIAIEERTKETKKAVLSSIRAQLDPHFVSNVFSYAQKVVLKHENSADSFNNLGRMSRLVKEILQLTDQDEIPLNKELEICKNYAELMCEINNEQFSIDFEFSKDVDYYNSLIRVPPLTIQPLIENAFKYAFTNESNKPFIKISVPKEMIKNQVICIISDNGKGIRKDKLNAIRTGEGLSENSMGWRLLRKRFELSGVDFKIESEISKGTVISLYFNA